MSSGLRTMVFVVLLLGILAASWLLMFKPQRDEIDRLNADTREKAEKLASLVAKTAGGRDLPAEIEKRRRAIEILDVKLPEQKEMADVLDTVWKTARANGLSNKSVRPMKTVAGDGFGEYSIRMVIVGPFGDPKEPDKGGFYPFLRSVEEMKRITRISEMTIEKDPKNEGQMQADLLLTIYFENTKDGQAVAELK